MMASGSPLEPTDGQRTFLVMLGSRSKGRRNLIKSALQTGFELFPEFVSPNIDEKAIRCDNPSDMVLQIADAKATKLEATFLAAPLDRPRPDFIICADQVIVFNDTVREKPESEDQCKEHMQSYGLQQVPAVCMTGVIVLDILNRKRYKGVDVATQHFKEIPDDVALALIDRGDVMHCAGSFVVEDPLIQPFLGKREGEIESIQGMPFSLTNKLLDEARLFRLGNL